MEFRPLHPDFGAQVIGFDVMNGRDPADIETLREAYDKYSLLLFRGGEHLPHERHLEIAGWFGPPDPVDNSGNGDYVSVLHNRDMAGSMQLPFHCDLTYTDFPIKAICLQAIELPGTPTSTTFVSNFAGWNHLPPELKNRCEGLTVEHVHISKVAEFDWPDFIAEHPVKFIHPRNGRPMLMCTEHHAERILGLPEDESRALIAELFEHQYRPERQYDNVWQLNDIIMFDNLAAQHARREKSDYAGGPRALQRVALCEITLQQSIDMARAKQAA